MKIDTDGLTGELAKRVSTLLNTPEGTLVFDRKYGLNMGCIDGPPEAVESVLFAEMEEKLAVYEPGAKIEDIAAQVDAQGNLYVKVVMANAIEPDE